MTWAGAPGRRRPRAAALALALGLAVAAVGAGLVLRPAAERAAAGGASPAALLPAPVKPAFTPPRPRRLAPFAGESRWAPVLRPTLARRAPDERAPVVTAVASSTPEGTPSILLVLGRATDEAGRVWVRTRLPVLPNNTTAWVPRSALGGYSAVTTHIVVDLAGLRATLYRRGRALFEAPVGVGQPAWPTPTGRFYIRNKLTSFKSPVYGPVAFGTSARSDVLTDWPAGGYIGIHGTNEPELLPGRVSHGCIRLRNDDILALARLMPIGTPLTIR
jgi:lipoprotein-anchoring transpeptidase ErfK/SrfK